MRLAALLTRRGDSLLAFSGWILDHWSWRVMLVAEGFATFPVACNLAEICSRPSGGPRPGCKRSERVAWWKPCAGKIPNSRGGKEFRTCVLCCATYPAGLPFILLHQRADGTPVLAPKRDGNSKTQQLFDWILYTLRSFLALFLS